MSRHDGVAASTTYIGRIFERLKLRGWQEFDKSGEAGISASHVEPFPIHDNNITQV